MTDDLTRALLRERQTGMPRWQVRKMRDKHQPEPLPEWTDVEIARHRAALDDYYPAMEATA